MRLCSTSQSELEYSSSPAVEEYLALNHNFQSLQRLWNLSLYLLAFEPSLQETSPPIETRTSFARTGQLFLQFSEAPAPLSTPAHVISPPQETHCSMRPHNSRPTRIEASLNQTAYHVKSTRTVNKIPQSVTPAHAPQRAENTSGHVRVVDKQTLKQKMPDQEIRGCQT